MIKNKVRTGVAYLYIETITGMISTYVFWLVLSKITNPGIIGAASAMISFAAIVTAFAEMGVPSSVQRFLGKSFIEKETQYTALYVRSSLLIVLVSTCLCSIAIFLSKDLIYSIFKISFNLIIISIVLIASVVIRYLFRSIIIASLSTKILVFSTIIPTILRFVIAIILIFLNLGAVGVAIGYAMFPVVGTITLVASIVKFLKPADSRKKPDISALQSIKNIVRGGIPNWIPNVMIAVGLQLGTIVILGSQGSYQAGIYFIALSIFTAISTTMSSIFSITYPVMSAMKDGRKRFTLRTINISLFFCLPLCASLFFYSSQIMHLFGYHYIQGAASLEILMISVLPTAVITGMSTLSYSYGNYRQVLIIGLATSLPRTVLYFLLVPIYSNTGAAWSNTIGALIGFAVAVIIAKKMQMPIMWKDLTLIFAIPMGIGFLLSNLGIHYLLGIVLTLMGSYVLYLRTKILSRLDIEDVLGVLPTRISDPVIKVINSFGRKINKSY
jgi:O-antigen/teichoic acid export membrane protein